MPGWGQPVLLFLFWEAIKIGQCHICDTPYGGGHRGVKTNYCIFGHIAICDDFYQKEFFNQKKTKISTTSDQPLPSPFKHSLWLFTDYTHTNSSHYLQAWQPGADCEYLMATMTRIGMRCRLQEKGEGVPRSQKWVRMPADGLRVDHGVEFL